MIIPSIDELRKTLVAAFSTIYSQGWFLDQIGSDALWLLQNKYSNFEPIAIAPRIYLYPCNYRNSVSTSNCLVYSLWTIAMHKSIPCDACKDEKNGNKKRLYRHSSEEWTSRIQDTSSKVRLSYLTPAEMMERYSALKQKARANKRKLANVEKKLTSHLDEITLDDADQNMKDILKSAMTYVTNNETSCQKAILQALLDLEQKRVGASKAQRHDEDSLESTNEELAELILNQMKNIANVIAGKECNIRYSAQTVWIAMSLWLRSPAAYREFKDAYLTIIPSKQYLRSMKTMLVYEEGDTPRIYGWYQDEIVSKNKEKQWLVNYSMTN